MKYPLLNILVTVIVFFGVVVEPHAQEVWQDPVTGMEFVWVPPGCGYVAIDDWRYEKPPLNRVCLKKGFWIGKYEVTQKEWVTIMGSNPSDHRGQRLPVDSVVWLEANEFAEKLSEKSSYSFRLPTQIEWEYAARAGTKTTRFWGDDDENACRYANVRDQTNKEVRGWDGAYFLCDDGYAFSSPVGSFSPNQFGLHDMIGNVGEWCLDSCNGDPARSVWDFIHGHEEVLCTVRGGGWGHYPSGVNAHKHASWNYYDKYDFMGFRLVRVEGSRKPAYGNSDYPAWPWPPKD